MAKLPDEPDEMRVKEFFATASELPLAEREGYVRDACAGDEPLRARVQALLDAHSMADAFMNTDAAAEEMSSQLGDLDTGGGRQIGAYTLHKLLGEGGFGSVYLAEQHEPVRRRVAIKLIKPGMDTRQVIARFDAERQALAMMDHPNIARIFDAAATSTGRPYFVMELVEGLPITDYCDTHQLDVRERLKLLMGVCQAVHHAHQKGVIHRDLKPSNVLVSVIDGIATPKVIDFGIAKALTDRLTPHSAAITELRQMIGTPQYMSPEQAQSDLTDADTRSDIYSLGVLMYELLTGVTPFDADALRVAAVAEVHRILREVEPPRPSTRLSGVLAIEQVAADRQTEPARLGTLLRRELDWVVMKCLEKDRARRYGSAADLAADLGRYLAGESVSAVAPTRSYRLSKLVARHRVAVLAASVASLGVVAGIAALAFGFRAARLGRAEAIDALAEARASRDLAVTREREAATQRAAAESSGRVSASLNHFLREMLAAADPVVGAGRDVTVQSVLDRATANVPTRFAQNPDVEAAIRDTLGGTYHALGYPQKAVEQFERAAAIQRERHGVDSPESTAADGFLADTLISLGRYDEAASLSRLVLERTRRQHGPTSPEALNRVVDLAVAIQMGGNPAEALPLYREAAEGLQRTVGDSALATIQARGNVGSTLSMLGDDAGAAQELEAILKAIPDDSPDGAKRLALRTARVNYAGVLVKLNRAADAEPILVRTLASDRATYGDDHPFTIHSAHTLASTLSRLERRDEAITLWQRTLDAAVRTLGTDHPHALAIRRSFAGTLIVAGRPREAIEVLAAAWATLERTGSATQPSARPIASLFAQAHDRLGEPDAAAAWRARLPTTGPATSPSTVPAIAPATTQGNSP